MMKSLLRLGTLLSLLGLCTSCASLGGPKITACVVDAPYNQFVCSDSDGNRLNLPLQDGSFLSCYSRYDLEVYLKSCRDGRIVPIPYCRYSEPKGLFHCQDNGSHAFDLATDTVDNYLCMNETDRKRIEERCWS